MPWWHFDLMNPENIRCFDLIQCVIFNYTLLVCMSSPLITNVLVYRDSWSSLISTSVIMNILPVWPLQSLSFDLTWSSNLPGDGLQPLPGHYTLRIDQTMEVSLDPVVHQHLPYKTGFKSFVLFFPLHLEADTYSIYKTQCLYTQL
jgi:hypothetical protein